MHAGPQLTVGWNNVSKECANSRLVGLTSMYDLIKSDWGLELKCAIESVPNFHMKYGPNLIKYFEKMGMDYHKESWCNPQGEMQMPF